MSEERDRVLGELLDRLRKKFGHRAVPYAIVLIEEFARELSEIVPKPEIPRPVTKKIEILNKVSSARIDVANIVGKGKLREYVIISNSPNYTIELNVDSNPKIPNHRNINDLINISPYLDYLDAFTSDSEYILRISNINFLKGFQSVIYPLEKVAFSRIFVLYDLYP